MAIDCVFAELKSMYRADLDGTDAEIARLSGSDIQRWCADLEIPKGALYDQVALHLATGFYRNELSFGFCDNIVNSPWTRIHPVHALSKRKARSFRGRF